MLDGSGTTARPIEERYEEDFEILRRDDRVAIAEAKGVNRGVSLQDVNQVNQHRTEIVDASAEELPGLLVVNAFRSDDGIERRRTEIHDRIRRHAVRMNVCVLRSVDLYALLERRLGGADDAEEIAKVILKGGGGWLKVDRDTLELIVE